MIYTVRNSLYLQQIIRMVSKFKNFRGSFLQEIFNCM